MTVLVPFLAAIAAGAVAVALYLSRQVPEPVDAPASGARSETPRQAVPLTEPSAAGAVYIPAPTNRPFQEEVDGILLRFETVWQAPLHLVGRERTEALRRRDREVRDLATEMAALGEEVVEEIRYRLQGGPISHEERILFGQALSILGTEAALGLLAEEVTRPGEYRWRDYAFRMLLESEGESRRSIALGILPAIDDPRLVARVLRAGWDEKAVEAAYRAWLAEATERDRIRTYSYLSHMEGAWMGTLLMDAASHARTFQEWAGAIGALGTPDRFEGALEYLLDALWTEDDPAKIRVLVAAIKRLGGEDSRSHLEEYAATGAPDDATRQYVERAARTQMQVIPATGGAEGGIRIEGRQVDPEAFPGHQRP
jgi:hypothetical protein